MSEFHGLWSKSPAARSSSVVTCDNILNKLCLSEIRLCISLWSCLSVRSSTESPPRFSQVLWRGGQAIDQVVSTSNCSTDGVSFVSGNSSSGKRPLSMTCTIFPETNVVLCFGFWDGLQLLLQWHHTSKISGPVSDQRVWSSNRL